MLSEHLGQATKDELAPHRFLDRLLDDEITHREERRIKTSLKLSGLPIGQTLSTFDFGFQPAVERSRIETLATCSWIRERESLLIQGPPDPATYCSISLLR
ncbi:transposase/IS protein [compost metagenome]